MTKFIARVIGTYFRRSQNSSACHCCWLAAAMVTSGVKFWGSQNKPKKKHTSAAGPQALQLFKACVFVCVCVCVCVLLRLLPPVVPLPRLLLSTVTSNLSNTVVVCYLFYRLSALHAFSFVVLCILNKLVVWCLAVLF